MPAAPRDPTPPFASRSARATFALPATSPAGAMNIKWLALHDAAGVVAALAGLRVPSPGAAERNFPAAMRDAGGWRRKLAEQGTEDLSAIMQAGLTALLAVHATGASALAPARALWAEFVAARAALLALNPVPAAELRSLA